MSITDGLREWARHIDANPHLGYLNESGVQGLTNIADRIDAEYEATVNAMLEEYVKLPVDADGVTIHLGDEVCYKGEADVVSVLSLSDSRYCTWCFFTVDDAFDDKRDSEHGLLLLEHPELFRHVQPDSWERIIADAIAEGFERTRVDAACGTGNAELVERCRRLAGDAE